MSQPPPYTIATDFSADEAGSQAGRSTVRTTNLDTEFTNLKATVDIILANLIISQADDGSPVDSWVDLPALSADIPAAIAELVTTLPLNTQVNFSLDTGVADAYVIANAIPITGYATGQTYWFKALNTNAGASTINVDNQGLKAIVKPVAIAVAANDILAGMIVGITYDGTAFQMTNDGIDITAHVNDTANPHTVTKAQVGLTNVSDDAQLKIASNLSDVASATTSRVNLGLDQLKTDFEQMWVHLIKTADYIVVVADVNRFIRCDATAGVMTITLPPAATAGTGFMLSIKKVDGSANAVTIDADGSEKIDGVNTFVLPVISDSVLIICDSAAWHVVSEISSLTTDKAVEVSSDDTTPGDLETKLLAGDGITLSTQNPAGNETRTIALSVPQNVQVFTSSGTWNQPANVTEVFVEAVGGAGAGAGVVAAGEEGGGGGGGAWIRALVTVSGNITVTVGTGGIGDNGDGNNGLDTTFAALVTAKAGQGGTSTNEGAGGSGGSFSSTTTTGTLFEKRAGESGGAGVDTTKGGDGGQNGLLLGKISNGGLNNGNPGTIGIGLGCGGGGAEGDGSTHLGGDGTDGYVIVWW